MIAILAPLFMLRKVKENIKTNLLFAVFFSIIGSYCWHYGLHMVPVNCNNHQLYDTNGYPCFGVFLKEKLPKTLIASIIICFVSIILINKPKEILKLGYLLLLVGVCCYSISIVISKN